MKMRVLIVSVVFMQLACAPIVAPETPPRVAPPESTPQREPLLPAPSNTPKIVYA